MLQIKLKELEELLPSLKKDLEYYRKENEKLKNKSEDASETASKYQ